MKLSDIYPNPDNPRIIRDEKFQKLKRSIEEFPKMMALRPMVVDAAGFGVQDVIEKHFEPQGYTALFLLSESHFAIHTFPEGGQTYIELTSCVKQPFDAFVSLM